jgi:hypothetical protein
VAVAFAFFAGWPRVLHDQQPLTLARASGPRTHGSSRVGPFFFGTAYPFVSDSAEHGANPAPATLPMSEQRAAANTNLESFFDLGYVLASRR